MNSVNTAQLEVVVVPVCRGKFIDDDEGNAADHSAASECSVCARGRYRANTDDSACLRARVEI